MSIELIGPVRGRMDRTSEMVLSFGLEFVSDFLFGDRTPVRGPQFFENMKIRTGVNFSKIFGPDFQI